MKRREIERIQKAGKTVAVKTGVGRWNPNLPTSVVEASILALGVERSTTPRTWSARESAKDGVLVRFTGERFYSGNVTRGHETVVRSADVLEEWEPFARRTRERIEAEEKRREELKDDRVRAKNARERFRALGYDVLKVDVFESPARDSDGRLGGADCRDARRSGRRVLSWRAFRSGRSPRPSRLAARTSVPRGGMGFRLGGLPLRAEVRSPAVNRAAVILLFAVLVAVVYVIVFAITGSGVVSIVVAVLAAIALFSGHQLGFRRGPRP